MPPIERWRKAGSGHARRRSVPALPLQSGQETQTRIQQVSRVNPKIYFWLQIGLVVCH
jgi:hypothetical protein